MGWRKQTAPGLLQEVQERVERFEARLDSERQGIAFHVVFHARVRSVPVSSTDPDEAARAVRIALRHEAADFLRQVAATDLYAAHDLLAREMARTHTLVDPEIRYDARVDVTLLPGDQAAVEALLAAQREQSIATAIRREEIRAVAEELSEPAGIMARWASTDAADWAKRAGEAKALAEVFAGYRPPGRQGVEYALVESVREFFASFHEPAQKQMLYGLLSSGMQRAGRLAHAARVEEIAEAARGTQVPAGGA